MQIRIRQVLDRETKPENDRRGEVRLMSQVQLGQSNTHTQDQALLQVRNLKVVFHREGGGGITSRFGGGSGGGVVRAVDDLSFDLYKSEILAIVGESGSGKTTTARCIMRFIRPTSGSIRFDGNEVAKTSHGLINYRRKVQMIYQDPFESLNPRQDVFTIVAAPLRLLAGENDKTRLMGRVSELLEEVGLDPLKVMRRYPHQLSGGERQRVNIARAIAPSPSLLLADEPITMLDAAQRLRILSLLAELKRKRNLTILMITHDITTARILSDRVIVMYMGKMVESGDSQTVFARPHHPYTSLIIEATPPFSELKTAGRDSSPSWSADLTKGCVFRVRCKYRTQVCDSVDPPLEEKTKAHSAACHNPLNVA